MIDALLNLVAFAVVVVALNFVAVVAVDKDVEDVLATALG